MARYRKIDVRIWNDEKFSSLSDIGQLVFLFVLTHPSMTSLGALRGSPEGLAGEKYGWSEDKKAFREAFREGFLETFEKGLLKYDERGLLFAPNFVKYNAPESPNVIRAWRSSLDYLPECPLLVDVLMCAESRVDSMSEGYKKAFAEAFGEVLKEALAKAMPNQEQEQKQEQEYINHNKQTTEIRYGETTGPDPVCLENSLSENIRNAQDNSCDESKFEDDDSLLTVLEVIKLCSYNRLKVARSQRLVEVVNSGVVSVGMVKECIDITKASNGSGAYFVGCLANAIHEPERYLTTIQKIRRSEQKEKEAEQFLLEHGDEVF